MFKVITCPINRVITIGRSSILFRKYFHRINISLGFFPAPSTIIVRNLVCDFSAWFKEEHLRITFRE